MDTAPDQIRVSNIPLGIVMPGSTSGSIPRQTYQKMMGNSGGTTGPDNDFAAAGAENIGAWMMGRNMFGPHRGASRGGSDE